VVGKIPWYNLGFVLLHTTGDNDLIILCEHNNFVVINFVFSKNMDYGLPITYITLHVPLSYSFQTS
jgi:hypothetical protein